DAVLVGIEAGERLGEGLADAVAAVRSRYHLVVDLPVARVEADRVIARRHDDALDAGPPRRLEEIVRADDVRLNDRLPLALAGEAAQMDDAVDAVDHALDRRHVRELGTINFLPGARRSERHAIGDPDDPIDALQTVAQRPADAPACARDKHPIHSVPPFALS